MLLLFFFFLQIIFVYYIWNNIRLLLYLLIITVLVFLSYNNFVACASEHIDNTFPICLYYTKTSTFLLKNDSFFTDYTSLLNKFPYGLLNYFGFAYDLINDTSKLWSILRLENSELIKKLYNDTLDQDTLNFNWKILLDCMRFEKILRFIYNPNKPIIWIQSFCIDTGQIWGFSLKNNDYIFLIKCFKNIYNNSGFLIWLQDISMETIKKNNLLENMKILNLIIFEIHLDFLKKEYNVYFSDLTNLNLNKNVIFNCILNEGRYLKENFMLMRLFIFLDSIKPNYSDSGFLCDCKDLAPINWNWQKKNNIPDNISVAWYNFDIFVSNKLKENSNLPLYLPKTKCVFDLWRFFSLIGENSKSAASLQLGPRDFVFFGFNNSYFFSDNNKIIDLTKDNFFDFISKHETILKERHALYGIPTLNNIDNEVKPSDNIILLNSLHNFILNSDCLVTDDFYYFDDNFLNFLTLVLDT